MGGTWRRKRTYGDMSTEAPGRVILLIYKSFDSIREYAIPTVLARQPVRHSYLESFRFIAEPGVRNYRMRDYSLDQLSGLS